MRVFRLSRIQGKVAYATKAEHDFQRPADFDPRVYANRIPWQLGDTNGTAEIWVSDRIAWHVERNFGPYGEMADAEDGDGRVFRTPYSISRLVIAWALGYGEHARIVGPPELVSRGARAARLDHRAPPRRAVHRAPPRAARPAPRTPRPPRRRAARARRRRSGPSASPASSRSRPC